MARESGFVAHALWMTAGLIVWAAHLGAVYAWTAVVCARRWVDATVLGMGPLALGIAAATAAAVLITAVLLVRAFGRVRSHPRTAARFADRVSLLASAFSLVAILWTALPVMVIDRPCGAAEASPANHAPGGDHDALRQDLQRGHAVAYKIIGSKARSPTKGVAARPRHRWHGSCKA